jgi:serine/threonine protein kinase
MKQTRKRNKLPRDVSTQKKNKKYKNHLPQSGGLKLGQGSYGCVIAPAVKCPNSSVGLPSQQSISKIIYKDPKASEKYDREMVILRKIAEIDKKQHYLIGVLDECQLDVGEIMTRKTKDTAIVKFTDPTRSNWVLSDSSSSDLEHLNREEIKSNYCLIDPKLQPRNQIQVNGGAQFDSILTTSRSRNFGIVRRYYLNIIKDILIGIQLLHKSRIAHRDIKESNMVCQIIPLNRKNKPNDFYPVVRHIDFGLAEIVNPDKTYTISDVRYAGTHTFVPPDLHIVRSRFICMFKQAQQKQEIPGNQTTTQVKINLDKLLDSSVKRKIIDELHTELKNKSYKDYAQIGITPEIGLGIRTTASAQDYYNNPEFISKDTLGTLYDNLLTELRGGTYGQKYTADYDGYVYKTDIFAAGITIARIRYYLQIRNPKLMDLIANMVRVDPNKRFNINQCLAHPLFKN